MKKLLIFCSQLFFLVSISAGAAEKLQWDELKFKAASGVPQSAQHRYSLEGILNIVDVKTSKKKFLYVTTSSTTKNKLVSSFWAKVSGDWDGKKQLATERINFGGEIAGSLKSVFKCSKDPWLYRTSCTVMETKFSTNENPTRDWRGLVQSKRKPLSEHKVNLAQAKSLSAKSSAPPPPPPPSTEPKAKGKSFKKPKKKKPVVPARVNNNIQVKKAGPTKAMKAMKARNELKKSKLEKKDTPQTKLTDEQLKKLKKMKKTKPKKILKKAEEIKSKTDGG